MNWYLKGLKNYSNFSGRANGIENFGEKMKKEIKY